MTETETHLKARVFISYSRKDLSFVIRLAGALTEARYFVDFDLGGDTDRIEGGLAPTDEWWARLKENLSAADVVIFVVSPESIASRVCDDEIAEAQSLSKRLIPIRLRAIDFKGAPQRLAALNVAISFESRPGEAILFDEEFSVALHSLCRAIDVDINWLREGSRLTALAARWKTGGCPADQLLRTGAINAAEMWAARRPGGVSSPPEILLEFFAASRAREDEDRRRLRSITGRAFLRPAAVATNDGDVEHALRLLAAGVCLSDDVDMTLVPASRNNLTAASVLRCRAVLSEPYIAGCHPSFSGDGTSILTTSAINTARLWNASVLRELSIFIGHTSSIFEALFNADSSRVLTASYDLTARVWDTHSGKEIANFPIRAQSGIPAIVAFSPDGSLVATADPLSNVVKIWDVATMSEKNTVRSVAGNYSLSFSRDGRRIISSSNTQDKDHGLGSATVWDVQTGKRIFDVPGQSGKVWAARFSPDGSLILTLSDDKAIIIDAETGLERAALDSGKLRAAVFSPDGKLALCCHDSSSLIWDIGSGNTISSIEGVAGSESPAVFSPDSARLVTVLNDRAKIWDTATGAEICVLRGHSIRVVSAIFSPDGRAVLTAALDDTVRVWQSASSRIISTEPIVSRDHKWAAISPDGRFVVGPAKEKAAIWRIDSAEVERTLEDTRWEIRSAEFSQDGRRILTTSVDNATLWEVDSGRKMHVFRHPDSDLDTVRSAALSSDSRFLATCSEDATVRIWDAASGRQTVVLEGHSVRTNSARFSPKNDRVVTTSDDGSARVWDATTGREIARIPEHLGPYQSAAFSPDGQRIFTWSASLGSGGRIWDANSGRAIAEQQEHAGFLKAAAFAPDGHTFVTGGEDGVIRACDAHTGKTIAVLRGHTDRISSIEYNTDGDCVVTAGDLTARLWDAASWHEIAVLKAHSKPVQSVKFSRDGHRLVTLSDDETIKVWDVGNLRALVGAPVLGLAAALANGIGRRSAAEREHYLMADAPDDLFAALMEKLSTSQRVEVQKRAELLRQPFHPNCYANPVFGRCVPTATVSEQAAPLNAALPIVESPAHAPLNRLADISAAPQRRDALQAPKIVFIILVTLVAAAMLYVFAGELLRSLLY